MDSGTGTRALPRVGFPIRRSRDQRLVSTYSGLIAAAHVLHRLLAPRHPPCALSLLIMKNTFCEPLWSFQGAHGPGARTKREPLEAVSQNSAAYETSDRSGDARSASRSTSQATSRHRGRRNSRRARTPDDRARRPSTSRAPTGVIAPASLERR